MAKVIKFWGKFGIILGRNGEDVIISGLFYFAVVQDDLIYRYDMWVIIDTMTT